MEKNNRMPDWMIAVLVIVGMVLYLCSPLDVIPDVFFPVGFLDDLGILGLGGAKLWKLLNREEPITAEVVESNK